MASMQLSTPSYVKHAFRDQHNVLLLLGAVCFSVAFATPLPLLVGAAGELIWLLVGPRLPAFRAWVDRQLSAQYLARSEAAIEDALRQLPEADARRFRKLSAEVTALGQKASERLSPRERQLGEHGLLELRRTFLDYSFLGQRLSSLRDPTPSAELEKEAAQLQESYSAERELTARMTIRQALSALQRRIGQQTALTGVERSLELRLEMLEMAVPQVRARLADPAFYDLTPEIDTALAEIGPAEALELSVDEIFDGPTWSALP